MAIILEATREGFKRFVDAMGPDVDKEKTNGDLIVKEKGAAPSRSFVIPAAKQKTVCSTNPDRINILVTVRAPVKINVMAITLNFGYQLGGN